MLTASARPASTSSGTGSLSTSPPGGDADPARPSNATGAQRAGRLGGAGPPGPPTPRRRQRRGAVGVGEPDPDLRSGQLRVHDQAQGGAGQRRVVPGRPAGRPARRCAQAGPHARPLPPGPAGRSGAVRGRSGRPDRPPDRPGVDRQRRQSDAAPRSRHAGAARHRPAAAVRDHRIAGRHRHPQPPALPRFSTPDVADRGIFTPRRRGSGQHARPEQVQCVVTRRGTSRYPFGIDRSGCLHYLPLSITFGTPRPARPRPGATTVVRCWVGAMGEHRSEEAERWAATTTSSRPAWPTRRASGSTRRTRSTGPRPPTRALDASRPPFYRWFPDGELNVCHNALDRHVDAGRGDQPALIYDSPVTGTRRSYTYAELRDEVARFAGVLAGLGVGPGRPRGDLPADGARGRGGHARLRPDRRGALGGVRRVRARRSSRSASTTPRRR